MSRQIILDTETTGIQHEQGHRIIEIGCVELVNRRITNNRFHCYINPEREIEAGAQAVHGITSEFLQDKPLFADVAKDFIDFVQGAELIIHNAPFDVGFLNYELQLTKQNWLPLTEYCRIFDTLALARKMHAGMRNSLDALCKRYSVDNKHREFHGALLDSYLLAQVYLAMTEGQRSLLDELDKTTHAVAQKFISKINTLRNKIVIKATPEEEQLHEDYLQKMVKQGKCLWAGWRDG
ncbi:MAG TPA: DNA polymerase III subunit epsilon [Gammaproteobacteria bacterium]|nr:DNA polymerase III subunit epsilon [Gammaproteobacteria bacterium]